MLKTFAMTIVFAAFAWAAAASTSARNTQPAQVTAKNVQLAQAGGRFCPRVIGGTDVSTCAFGKVEG